MIHGNNEAASPPIVLVIMGSIRANRRCPTIAEWIVGIARTIPRIAWELVDLAGWNLPMDDEPDIPASGIYIQEHTRAWSSKIAGAAGIIFVTPQYNWGYPAPLKNAIDHLHREWRGKPLLIVTYGSRGGGKCAAQLRQIAEGLEMKVVPTMPALALSIDVIRGAPLDPGHELKGQIGPVQQGLAELAVMLDAGGPDPQHRATAPSDNA